MPRSKPADVPQASGWPPEFDAAVYTRHRMNRLIRWLGPRLAAGHYAVRGRRAGRPCSSITTRADFAALIAPDARILEIGPFFSPFFDRDRHRVSYVDVLTTEQLRERAAQTPGGVPDRVPEIDFVWTGGSLCDLTDERFDVVFSSHNI